MKQPYKVMSWLSTLGPGTQSMWILFGTGNLYKYILRFVQIHFAICTNTFWMLYKYIVYVVQIHFVCCTNTFCNLHKYILQCWHFQCASSAPWQPNISCFCCKIIFAIIFMVIRLLLWNYTFAQVKAFSKYESIHFPNICLTNMKSNISKCEFVHLPNME